MEINSARSRAWYLETP